MNKSVNYNLERKIVASNDLIKGRQFMPVREAGLIKLIIAQVAKEDKDYQTYTCKIKDLSKFWGIAASNIYRDIKKICLSLMRQVVVVENESDKVGKKKWKMLHWIDTAQYDGDGNVIIRLSDDIKPYVLQLSAWFTQIELKNIIGMKSFYSQRIYEILKCDLGIKKEYDVKCTYEIEKLREILCCEQKYKEFGNFKKQVLEKSIREINMHTDININLEYGKTGKSITQVTFYIKSKINKDQKKITEEKSNSDNFVENRLKENFLQCNIFDNIESLLKSWFPDHNFSKEMFLKAYGICMDSIGKCDLSYINGILKKWEQRGFKTLSDVNVPYYKSFYEDNNVSYNLEDYEKESFFD